MHGKTKQGLKMFFILEVPVLIFVQIKVPIRNIFIVLVVEPILLGSFA